MPDHAIVIGIDAYAHEEWRLSCAVRDAVAFARWVTMPGAGRAEPDTLTLLLSPRSDQAPTDLPFRAATREAIHSVLDRYAFQNAGASAERLWIFYAGHGVSPFGGGFDAAPVLIPEDVTDLPGYLRDRPLELSRYLGGLQLAPPRTQIFFVDACRGLCMPESAVTAMTQLHFDLRRLGDPTQAMAHQVAIYGTTAGTLANELGLHGLFGQALLEGLTGRGPELRPDLARQDLVLTVNALGGYIQRRVQSLAERARDAGKPLPTQVPVPDLFGTTGDLPLLRFSLAEAPTAQLEIVVEPEAASAQARAGIRVWNSIENSYDLVKCHGPNADVFRWRLPLGLRGVEVYSPGYLPWAKMIQLERDIREVARLQSGQLRGYQPLQDWPRAFATLEMLPGTQGELFVSCPDRYTRVEVFDATGVRVAAGRGDLTLRAVPVGAYRVEVHIPGTPARSLSVLVHTRHKMRVEARPEQPAPKALTDALCRLGMTQDRGLARPTAAFGETAITRIGSLLAWAAWMSRFPLGGPGEELRAVGVDPCSEISAAGSGVLLLFGDLGSGNAPFFSRMSIAAGRERAEEPVAARPLAGLPSLAMQWTSADPELSSVLIMGAELGNIALPVRPLGGWLHVIIVAREADGSVDIHRYLFPALPLGPTPQAAPDVIRRAEEGWRALLSRTPLLPGEAEDVLADTTAGPLELTVLGYRLIREGRAAELLQERAGRSALQRIAQLAPTLADGQVLAALATMEPGSALLNRDIEPASCLVAEGYRAAASDVLRDPVRPLLPAEPWTVLDGFRGADLRGQSVLPIAQLKLDQHEWARKVLAVASVTGRLSNPAVTASPFAGTGFLVAPGLLLTCEHVIARSPDEALASGWTVSFGDAADPLPILSALPTRMSRAAGIAAADASLRFLSLGDVLGRRAAPLSFHKPRPGQRVVIVSYLAQDPHRATSNADSAHALRPGEKTAVLATVIDVSSDELSFHYDAWTVAGASGGPVIDVDSGAVIGMHIGGQSYSGAKRKVGVGFALSALRHEPMWKEVWPRRESSFASAQEPLEPAPLGGLFWTPVDGLVGGVVRCLAVDPLVRGRLAAGDFENGLWLREPGKDWVRTGLQADQIYTVAFSPVKPDVLVAGGPSGLFRSIDAGRTWNRLPESEDKEWRAVAFLPSGELLVGDGKSFSGCTMSSGAAAAASLGSGDTQPPVVKEAAWGSAGFHEERPDGSYASFAVRATNVIAVRADGAIVAGTSDDGIVFRLPGEPLRQRSEFIGMPIFAAAWLRSGEVAIGGRRGLSIGVPGGRFRSIPELQGIEVSSLVPVESGVWVGTVAGPAFLGATDDRLEWRRAGLHGAGIQSLVECNGPIIAGTDGQGVFEWQAASRRFTPTGHTRKLGVLGLGIDPGSGTLLAGSNLRGIYRSRDGGQSFSVVHAAAEGFCRFLALPETQPAGALPFADAGEVLEPAPIRRWLAGSQRGELLFSPDDGDTWIRAIPEHHELQYSAIWDMASIDGKVLIAAGRKGLYFWYLDPPRLDRCMVPHLEVATALCWDAARRRFWVGGARTRRAEDGRLTEQGLYRVGLNQSVEYVACQLGTISAILLGPPAKILVGGEGGIRLSQDDGNSFVTPAGSPSAGVYQLLRVNAELLLATTLSSGVYLSTDDGLSWSRSVDGLGSASHLHSAIALSTSHLLIGGPDGVFRCRLERLRR